MPVDHPLARPARPSVAPTVALAALAASALVAGTFAPWAQALGTSRSGTSWYGGVVPLGTAGALALVAWLLRRGAPARTASALAALGACWTGWKVLDVARSVRAAGAWAEAWGDLLDDVRPTTGFGAWLALAGCALTLAVAASALRTAPRP